MLGKRAELKSVYAAAFYETLPPQGLDLGKINFATLTNLKKLDVSSPGKYSTVELSWDTLIF